MPKAAKKATYVGVAPAKLDQAFADRMHNAIYNVWQQIGSDTISAAAECEESVSNAAALETCIDADRMSTFGHPQEDADLGKAIELYGYKAVMALLKKRIKLM